MKGEEIPKWVHYAFEDLKRNGEEARTLWVNRLKKERPKLYNYILKRLKERVKEQDKIIEEINE